MSSASSLSGSTVSAPRWPFGMQCEFSAAGGPRKITRSPFRLPVPLPGGVADRRVEPGPRVSPVALGGAVRDPQDPAGVLQREAGEVMQLDQLGLGRFLLGELGKRLVQGQQVVVGGWAEADGLVQAEA